MIAAIIQARMSSSRLPGKVLLGINGRPMFSYMVERVRSAHSIDRVIIATSTEPQDDAIADFCTRESIACYRGSLDDVLDRYYRAATDHACDVIVRLTADCPLIDPAVIDVMIDTYRSGSYDYVANSAPPEGKTYPDGMDVEVFSYAALARAWREAARPSEREHVTFYFWKNPGLFSFYRRDLAVDWGAYRLTVDYPEDFALVSSLIGHFSEKNPRFTMEEIISFLEANPAVKALNEHIVPNQGWRPSLERDEREGFHG